MIYLIVSNFITLCDVFISIPSFLISSFPSISLILCYSFSLPPLSFPYFSLPTTYSFYPPPIIPPIRYEFGLVSHSFAAAVKLLMKEFDILTAQLEHLLSTNRLSLQKMVCCISICDFFRVVFYFYWYHVEKNRQNIRLNTFMISLGVLTAASKRYVTHARETDPKG